MNILVAIASYGTTHDQYLNRLIAEYRSMRHRVDIVVLTEAPKSMGPDVEVKVGLPTKDPWSLPFAHKQLFADRVNDYDLFIYSEDDHLITEQHVEAFLNASKVLPETEIAGFLVIEKAQGGKLNFCGFLAHFHWDPASVRSRGNQMFAHFTNEHSACYMLTQAQLRRAILSGGFLVGPHQGKYDLLCSAATDPYTQCGFTKVICIS